MLFGRNRIFLPCLAILAGCTTTSRLGVLTSGNSSQDIFANELAISEQDQDRVMKEACDCVNKNSARMVLDAQGMVSLVNQAIEIIKAIDEHKGVNNLRNNLPAVEQVSPRSESAVDATDGVRSALFLEEQRLTTEMKIFSDSCNPYFNRLADDVDDSHAFLSQIPNPFPVLLEALDQLSEGCEAKSEILNLLFQYDPPYLDNFEDKVNNFFKVIDNVVATADDAKNLAWTHNIYFNDPDNRRF